MFEEKIQVCPVTGIKYFDEAFVKIAAISVPVDTKEFSLQPTEMATRLCYNSIDKLGQDTENFIKKIADKNHDTIWETIFLSVHIRGGSRIFTHQIITHRHLSKLQFSTRYNKDFCFVIPPFKFISAAKKLSLLKKYKRALEDYGSDDSPSNFKEFNRYFLPLGVEAPIYLSGNLRAWRDVFCRRLQKDVSPETYCIVKKIYEEIKKISEVLVYPLEKENKIVLNREFLNWE